MKITDLQRKRIYVLLADLETYTTKTDVVDHVTNGRTIKISDLTHLEANLVLRKLMEMQEVARRKMRGSIIYHLCTGMGMTDATGEPDWDRINGFIKNIGSRNPRRKKLYNLNVGEMRNVLTQVQMMCKKELSNT